MFNSVKKIRIDNTLYQKLVEMAERAGYSSTVELINHVLEREVAGLEDKLDQQQVEQQLRGLGYI